METVVLMSTFGSSEKAMEVAHALVEDGLAACVNVLPEMRSVYRWKGAVDQANEFLCLIKTTQGRVEEVRARIVELHTYEVPEVIALPIVAGHAPYLEWLIGEVK